MTTYHCRINPQAYDEFRRLHPDFPTSPEDLEAYIETDNEGLPEFIALVHWGLLMDQTNGLCVECATTDHVPEDAVVVSEQR